jgi:hypothetical protein
MSRDQNAGRSHIIKTDNSSFGRVEECKYLEITPNKSKLYSGINYEQTEIRECLPSFGAESFVFHFAIQKYKD